MITLDLPPWLLSALLAPFGLVLGSFCNVLIYRLPLEDASDRNVVTKPSHCPACKAPIRWYHNVPLASWIALRGKCAFCGHRIPVRYPLVELLGGLILAASVWVFPVGTLVWAKGVICAFALLVLFFTDFTEYMLPDLLQYPLMALGVLLTLPQVFWPGATTRVTLTGWDLALVDTWFNGLQIAPRWDLLGQAVDWKSSLIGVALGFGGPYAFERIYVFARNLVVVRIFKGDGIEAGMGMGDFKMLAWLGAFWGWQAMLGILGLGAVLMLAVALPLILFRRADAKTLFPFGCAMAIATPVVIFYGGPIWYGSQSFWEAYLGLFR